MSNEIKEIAIRKAQELYGKQLQKEIQERLELELSLMEENELDIMYFISKKLVDKVEEKGYLVSNRGKIGSSLVAYLLGITKVNPLSKQYKGFNIPFELQEDIEKNNKIDITITIADNHYNEICNYMDEILKGENIKTSVTENIKRYAKMYDRTIRTNDNKLLGSLRIQTSYHLEILEKLYKITNINPMQIEVEDDITKIGDIVIKNELFTGVDIIKLVDAMQDIEINTFDELVKILSVLYNTEDCIFSKSYMTERALLIYKIGWYSMYYEKEFNQVIGKV